MLDIRTVGFVTQSLGFLEGLSGDSCVSCSCVPRDTALCEKMKEKLLPSRGWGRCPLASLPGRGGVPGLPGSNNGKVSRISLIESFSKEVN